MTCALIVLSYALILSLPIALARSAADRLADGLLGEAAPTTEVET